ncbi:MAG TPA: thiamine pyrophosphate-dependent enzyme [Terriglobales bacterium]|nr:thiamine pyrophosphate-dependent enzyme [Terriglobales bacterium]
MLRLRLRTDDSSSSSRKFIGQEAAIVGCVIDLRGEDTVVMFPNQNVGLISSAKAKSANPTNYDAGYGLTTESVRLIELPHAPASVAWATGAALLHRTQSRGNLVLVFTGANEIERSRISRQFAHKCSLPIIYVQLETSPRKKSRSAPTRSTIQMPAIPVDKADLVAVYRVASEAIDKARRGAGPTLIQCVSYQQRGTRPALDVHPRDPIVYMEHYLRSKNLWSDELRKRAMEEVGRKQIPRAKQALRDHSS